MSIIERPRPSSRKKKAVCQPFHRLKLVIFFIKTKVIEEKKPRNSTKVKLLSISKEIKLGTDTENTEVVKLSRILLI